jgi:hypothetical protein
MRRMTSILALGLALAASGCFGGSDRRECIPSLEVCNGVDDDCNGLIDDTGRAEACNAEDDDCDGMIDEDFVTGEACDGDDTDACVDGVTICDPDGGGGVVCDDETEESPDLCNGNTDEDCSTDTPDGFGEPSYGMPCDSDADADLCPEGSVVCTGAFLVCNDMTGDSVEACNSLDDDCDGQADEDFDLTADIDNCGACGRACTNPHGTTSCESGQCVFACDLGAMDCNGDPLDGCESLHDANPTCAMVFDAGSVDGDAGVDLVREFTGTDESFVTIVLAENSDVSRSVTAAIELDSPPGMNFDLLVACGACGGGVYASSTQGEGFTDTVYFREGDDSGADDGRRITVEVRWVSGDICGEWTLRVIGGATTGLATDTCL